MLLRMDRSSWYRRWSYTSCRSRVSAASRPRCPICVACRVIPYSPTASLPCFVASIWAVCHIAIYYRGIGAAGNTDKQEGGECAGVLFAACAHRCMCLFVSSRTAPASCSEDDLWLDLLDKITSLQSYLIPPPNQAEVTAPIHTPSLLSEPTLAEDLITQAESSVEHHCNSCSVDCSRKRYHCRTQKKRKSSPVAAAGGEGGGGGGMANRTDPLAKSIHGTNPQNLVEKIVRSKIYQSTYWKEQCFGLTAETLVDKAMELDHTGGTYGGNRKPTPFLCLALKMLQIQPDKDIVVEFIKNEDYKYVRVLGAFYLRLTATVADVYQYLEPLYNDYRKIRHKLSDGKFTLTHVDEFIDDLLTKDYSCDTALPRIQKRWVLETSGTLEPRRSALEDDFEEEEEDKEDEQPMDIDEPNGREKHDHYRGRSPTRDRDRERKHERHHSQEPLVGQPLPRVNVIMTLPGTEITTEIGIMVGDGKETEIETVKEIETGIEIGIGIETVIAYEMRTTVEIGTEQEIGMAGKENAGTETVGGTGAVQGAGAGIDEKETEKMESTVGGVIGVVPVLEVMRRMVAQEMSRRRERKRKRRRVKEMHQIQMTQRL
uniref:Pre-mRNA-splicing factor 38 n=1 Tax=Oryza meridionalis TaxID=40149 RepID=A0A0E0EPB2_9ORYZ